LQHDDDKALMAYFTSHLASASKRQPEGRWHSPALRRQPAVTLARGFTTTLSGIAINHVPAFMVAQITGAFAAASVAAALFPSLRNCRQRATATRHEAIAPGE
jgi:hypothetical protein